MDPALRRALDYPYQPPQHSFALRASEIVAVDGPPRLDGAHRLALAFGSNAVPDVLRAKLGPRARVDVLHGWLADFDVVYSAHFSAYGAIPATLQRSPGSEVSLYALVLDSELLELLHATEPNYIFTELDTLEVVTDEGYRLKPSGAYLSRHGCLALDGSELALDGVPARARSFAQADERQVLSRARNRLAAGLSLVDFVAAVTSDEAKRATWSAALGAEAIPFAP